MENSNVSNGYWNHRVFVEDTSDGPWYSIRECFYDGEGKIWGCSAEPDGVCGESLDEIKQSLEWMLEALNHPVVRLEDVPEDGSHNPADVDITDLSGAVTLEEVKKFFDEKWGKDWNK